MALPKLSYPLFDVVIPSNNKKVKMRPFLVKEEKILLLAQTSEDPAEVVNAIKQVIEICMVNPSMAENLTTFDIEYLFVKLRARSVNNKIDILYRDPEDLQQYKVVVDLDKVEIKKDPKHDVKIELTKDLGIIMKYPSIDTASKIGNVETEIDLFFSLIKACLDKIYDAETVYEASDYTPEEIDEFVSSLDVNAFKKIQFFFESLPKLYYETTYTSQSGEEKKLVLQNLNDFFTLG
jgi:hypothetical protein